MLVVLCGLGPVCLITHLLGSGKEEKENASSNKLKSDVQIYSTKIMHL